MKTTDALTTLKNEITDELRIISNQIATADPEEVEQLEKVRSGLKHELSQVVTKINQKNQPVDDSALILITDRLINQTIEEYFKNNIWTHPDMVEAVEDYLCNGEKALKKYPENIQKWILIFSKKKYTDPKQKKIQEEHWMNHKTWVCIDSKGTFSFENCMRYRGNLNPDVLRRLLDDLSEKPLQQLVDEHELFHRASQKQENQKIEANPRRVHCAIPA